MKKLFNEILSIIQNTKNNSDAKKPPQELKFIANHPSNRRGMAYLKSEKEIRKDYKELFSLIVGQGNREVAINMVDSALWTPRIKDRHYKFLFNIIELLEKEVSLHFLFTLDWKAGVEDLEWHLMEATKEAGVNIQWPDKTKFPSDASVQYGLTSSIPEGRTSPVFEDYIRALNEVGLGLCFVESMADFFILCVYRLEDHKAVYKCVMGTGVGAGYGVIG